MVDQRQRMEKLTAFIEENPRDVLALYSLAMEYKSLGDSAKALEYFERVHQADPGQVASYFQQALVQISTGQKDQARATLEVGISKAVEAGHLHTRDKMRELLERLK